VVCKLTKITATTPKSYKLAFDCKHANGEGDPWTYNPYFALMEGGGKPPALFVQHQEIEAKPK
jgi:hypothetical protein